MIYTEARTYADSERRGTTVMFQGRPYRVVTAEVGVTLNGASVWFTLEDPDGQRRSGIHHTLVWLNPVATS